MTNCKEINDEKPKRLKFEVELTIDDNEREQVVKDLRGLGWRFSDELADLIVEG